MYYRGANAALLLYDITNAASFADVRGWLEGERSSFSQFLIPMSYDDSLLILFLMQS